MQGLTIFISGNFVWSVFLQLSQPQSDPSCLSPWRGLYRSLQADLRTSNPILLKCTLQVTQECSKVQLWLSLKLSPLFDSYWLLDKHTSCWLMLPSFHYFLCFCLEHLPVSPHMINFPSSVKPEPQYHFLQKPSLLESPGWLHTLSLLSAALSSILKILEGRTCVTDFVIPGTFTVDDLNIRKSKKYNNIVKNYKYNRNKVARFSKWHTGLPVKVEYEINNT